MLNNHLNRAESCILDLIVILKESDRNWSYHTTVQSFRIIKENLPFGRYCQNNVWKCLQDNLKDNLKFESPENHFEGLLETSGLLIIFFLVSCIVVYPSQ